MCCLCVCVRGAQTSATYSPLLKHTHTHKKTTGGRSARLVNPIAWEKGLVFAQCQHCDVWHTLAANNPRIYEEVRYDRSGGDGKRGVEGGGGASGSDSGASAGTVLGADSEGGGGDGAESR